MQSLAMADSCVVLPLALFLTEDERRERYEELRMQGERLSPPPSLTQYGTYFGVPQGMILLDGAEQELQMQGFHQAVSFVNSRGWITNWQEYVLRFGLIDREHPFGVNVFDGMRSLIPSHEWGRPRAAWFCHPSSAMSREAARVSVWDDNAIELYRNNRTYAFAYPCFVFEEVGVNVIWCRFRCEAKLIWRTRVSWWSVGNRILYVNPSHLDCGLLPPIPERIEIVDC